MNELYPVNHIVTFQEEGHLYTNEIGENYISATTIIKNFSKEFDGPYWSTYKAIKDVLVGKNQWDIYKINVGGWENVVEAWSNRPVHLDEVLDRAQEYITMWKKEGIEAAEKGTKEHLKREEEILSQDRVYGSSKFTKDKLFEVSKESLMKPNFEGNSIHVENILWTDHFKVAGMVDRVEREGVYLDIKDYKTNKQIDKTGFRGEKMLHPLSEILNCNFNHYTLQLSLYGWMLEQLGYKVRSLEIIHIKEDRDVKYPVEYMPGWVERMLHHYDKNGKYQKESEYNHPSIRTE